RLGLNHDTNGFGHVDPCAGRSGLALRKTRSRGWTARFCSGLPRPAGAPGSLVWVGAARSETVRPSKFSTEVVVRGDRNGHPGAPPGGGSPERNRAPVEVLYRSGGARR